MEEDLRKNEKPRSSIGIEMSDSHATFSVVSAQGVSKLSYVDRRLLPPGAVQAGAVISAETLISVLKPLAQECARFAPARFSFSVPTARMVSHVFTFPAEFSNDEVHEALASQLDEYFPFDASDCVLWFREVQRTNQTQTLFVCAISKDFLHQWMSVFEQSGMSVDFVDIEPMNIVRSVMRISERHHATLVVDVGRRMTYISIIDNRGMRDLKVLSCSLAKHFDRPDESVLTSVLEPTIHESKSMIRLIEDLHGITVSRILLCGKGAQLKEVQNVLERGIARLVEPYSQVIIPIDAEAEKYFFSGLPFEYANSTGVALGALSDTPFAPLLKGIHNKK